MTVLDEWFPRDPDRHIVTLEDLRKMGKTQFPRAAPDIRNLCDTFVIEAGWDVDPYTRKVVTAGARDWHTVHGGDCALLRNAMATMKRKGLTYSSPRSCITIAKELIGDPNSEANRRRYAEGPYADFIES